MANTPGKKNRQKENTMILICMINQSGVKAQAHIHIFHLSEKGGQNLVQSIHDNKIYQEPGYGEISHLCFEYLQLSEFPWIYNIHEALAAAIQDESPLG